MNITFMIGNGFDIGIGLKTRYVDFYPYFSDKSKETNMVKNQIEIARKNGDYEKWADLERALGEYTEDVLSDQYEMFIEDKIEMDELLIEYLQNERKKIEFDDDKISKIVYRALRSLRVWKVESEKNLVEGILSAYQGQSYEYRGICFNYTDCFDYFFNTTKRVNPIIGKHTYQHVEFTEKIGDILHIHGTLEDGEMILGVNDESQILNKELASLPEMQTVLIKPFLNSRIGQNKISKADAIINNSGIICIYGMSIEDTDKMWWIRIAKWLKGGMNRVLIIFWYDKEYVERHPYKTLAYKNRIKQQFIAQANLKVEEANNIRDRILIRVNDNIFAVNE